MKKRNVWLLISIISILPVILIMGFQAFIGLTNLIYNISSIIYARTLIPDYVAPNTQIAEIVIKAVLQILTPAAGVFFLVIPVVVCLLMWASSYYRPYGSTPTYVAVGITIILSCSWLFVVEGVNSLITFFDIGVAIQTGQWPYIFGHLASFWTFVFLLFFVVAPIIFYLISLIYIKEKRPTREE